MSPAVVDGRPWRDSSSDQDDDCPGRGIHGNDGRMTLFRPPRALKLVRSTCKIVRRMSPEDKALR